MQKLFYTIAQLGKKQSLTPEGYLLCEGVPIARTGEMIYGESELSHNGESVVSADQDGLIRIIRYPEEVFRPETMSSFNGKSVTDDHPPDGHVSPNSWKEKTIGITMNIRRGVGAEEDLLLADLLITTPEGIEAVRSGKREVSCGYQADYEEISQGVGKQLNIVGNHVALVESGRCGWRCAIGDRKFTKEPKMAKKSWYDRAIAAFKSQDEEGMKEALEEGKKETGDEGEETTHVHIHGAGAPGMGTTDEGVSREEFESHQAKNEQEHQAFRDDIEALKKKVGGSEESDDDDREVEGQLKEEAPTGTSDKARIATDSAFLVDSFKETVALAEVMVPGIRLPTFDHKMDPKISVKKICGFRRQALDLAYSKPETRGLIEEVLGGKTLDTAKMSCDAVRTVFRAVGVMRKLQNDTTSKGDGKVFSGDQVIRTSKIQSVTDINKMWDETHKTN